MSSVLTTSSAQSGSPAWTAESLDALSSTPGSAAVDFVVDAFSPKYLGSGTDVNGMLCTQTAVAKISSIGGTEAFSSLLSFGDTIATRQMQGSICADGWYIVVSYDSTNGTRVRYTTNGGASWSSYITVSAGANGSGWMPGLWMSQRTPGLAVATAFKAVNAFGGVNDTPSFGSWRRRFQINSTNGLMGWTLGDGTLSANGIEFALLGSPNAQAYIYASITLPVGTTVTRMYWKQCASPYRANSVGNAIYPSGNTSILQAAMGPNCTTTVTPAAFSETSSGTFQFYHYDQAPYISGGGAYITDFNMEGTGPNPFDSAVTGTAYVTQDYGATWTGITDSSIVGYIQPGAYPSGAIEAPYTDTAPQRFVYGTMDTGGTYPVPRLDRVSGTTTADISPVADGKTYGVPYSASHRRAINISVKDANTAILCGESRDATSGTSTYRVFLTRNLWAASPTWTPLTDESASVEWRGVYMAGDTPNAAYFLGTNGNFGYWNTTKSAVTIYNRKGDSTNSSSAVGLCGI